MRRIAHRGRIHDWPENAVESIPSALAETDGLEVDVRLSADEVPILMHDPDLDRTTDGAGPVEDRTADELAQLTVQRRGTIPRLTSYLDAAAAHGAPLVLVDLKVTTPECLAATVDACRYFPADRLLLAVRTDEALAALRSLTPDARLASLGITTDSVEARVASALACDAETLFIHHGDTAYRQHRTAVATIRSNGLVAGASTLRSVRTVELAQTDGCGLALVDLPLTTSQEPM